MKCEICKDTGYWGVTNLGTKEKPDVYYAECDMCDAPLDYDAFIASLNEHDRKLMEPKEGYK